MVKLATLRYIQRRLQMSVNNVNSVQSGGYQNDFYDFAEQDQIKEDKKNKDTFNADDVTAKIIDKAKGKKGSTDSVSAAAGTGAFSSILEFFGIASAGKKKMAELKQRDRQQKNAISAASVDLKRAKWDNQLSQKSGESKIAKENELIDEKASLGVENNQTLDKNRGLNK